MNGAEGLVRTLVAGGVDTCFANPGTSEMHLVAALDRVAGVRCVLGLFEGVVTGAADGYARMADRPALTLMHLGPGLANGIANLHNARKAGTPMLNIVGEHATYHRQYDAPLTSDIEGLAGAVSDWVRTSRSAGDLARDAADGLQVARLPPGRIATLIVPADTAWNEGGEVASVSDVQSTRPLDEGAVVSAAQALRAGRKTVLLIAGRALREPGLSIAGRIARHTGARLMGPTGAARAERGAGRAIVERVPYRIDQAVATLAGTEQAILCGLAAPVAFFAYPGRPSCPLPSNCRVVSLAEPEDDLLTVLEALEDAVGARHCPVQVQERRHTDPASGDLTLEKLGVSLAAMIPEEAILVDESITSSFTLGPILEGAAAHDYLQLTGGAIGNGPPLATGAAIAAPHRKTICLQADGSAMYTLQALWTQAREKTNVTTVILANRSYATLRGELTNVGIETPGPNAMALSDLVDPELDWVRLAGGMGVEGRRATSMEEFNAAFEGACASSAPFLIEARI
jgi:acetolactate synthase I/II/III large subunit